MSRALSLHGSRKPEKSLNFSSGLDEVLEFGEVLEKYLISLLGLKKALKFRPYNFLDK